jgi:uncharacterized membrane-anchored protein
MAEGGNFGGGGAVTRVSRFAIYAAGAGAAALLAALAVRYLLVEPQEIAQHCDSGTGPWWCWIRAALVQAFATKGLGALSLLAGVFAFLRRGRAAAIVAIITGCAGAVLYNTDFAVPGLLLGMLAAVRL